MTVSDLIRLYEEWQRSRLAPLTWSNRRSLLRQVTRELGGVLVDALEPKHCDRYAAARLEAGLRRVTVNYELRTIRHVLAFARRRGLCTIAWRVESLPGHVELRVKLWSEEEVTHLLAVTARTSPAITPLVTALANTGCRRGELIALPWERVNLKRGLIEIYPSSEWRPKSGRPREVPISDVLGELLDRLPRNSQWVFPSRNGRRWVFWPQLQFDRARAAAGLRGGVHTLRHSFASLFLARRPDLPLLAQILGHSDSRVTRLYAHLLPGHLHAARNVVQFSAPKHEDEGENE